MSIEEALSKLTAAVEANTAALLGAGGKAAASTTAPEKAPGKPAKAAAYEAKP